MACGGGGCPPPAHPTPMGGRRTGAGRGDGSRPRCGGELGRWLARARPPGRAGAGPPVQPVGTVSTGATACSSCRCRARSPIRLPAMRRPAAAAISGAVPTPQFNGAASRLPSRPARPDASSAPTTAPGPIDVAPSCVDLAPAPLRPHLARRGAGHGVRPARRRCRPRLPRPRRWDRPPLGLRSVSADRSASVRGPSSVRRPVRGPSSARRPVRGPVGGPGRRAGGAAAAGVSHHDAAHRRDLRHRRRRDRLRAAVQRSDAARWSTCRSARSAAPRAPRPPGSWPRSARAPPRWRCSSPTGPSTRSPSPRRAWWSWATRERPALRSGTGRWPPSTCSEATGQVLAGYGLGTDHLGRRPAAAAPSALPAPGPVQPADPAAATAAVTHAVETALGCSASPLQRLQAVAGGDALETVPAFGSARGERRQGRVHLGHRRGRRVPPERGPGRSADGTAVRGRPR